MSYELALRLKNAGFPLKCTIYSEDDFVFGMAVDLAKEPQQVMYPLLEELIEACGEGLVKLVREEENCWYAHGVNDTLGHGRTPSEAVANLWLALNKK